MLRSVSWRWRWDLDCEGVRAACSCQGGVGGRRRMCISLLTRSARRSSRREGRFRRTVGGVNVMFLSLQGWLLTLMRRVLQFVQPLRDLVCDFLLSMAAMGAGVHDPTKCRVPEDRGPQRV